LLSLTKKEVKLRQLEKAELPMLVTELGMVTEVKLLQPEKAELPMLVTKLGMISAPVRPLQPEKA
jgi:metal-sulfur cluster biosynthetic enzyme